MLLCHHSPAETGLARFCCVLDDIMLHTRIGTKYIIKGIFFHRYIYLIYCFCWKCLFKIKKLVYLYLSGKFNSR